MALTTEQKETILVALEKAYYSGALEVVTSDGKKARFDSRMEMRARIRELRAELGLSPPRGSRRKQVSYLTPRSDEV